MTVHLSARLAWHDTGWDGRVCADPKGNPFCVVHDYIRDSRDDAQEDKFKGRSLAEIAFRPPCSRDPGAYSPVGYPVTHHDPLEWRALPPVDEDILPFTVLTSPYGRMFADEGGWENDAGKQRRQLAQFFGELHPGRSLVFFYLKDGQPFVETSARIIAGIGRIKTIGPQLDFGGPGDENGKPYPIWSRAVTQNLPGEGFRLPLQEYFSAGWDATELLCTVPASMTTAFSYVAEHLSDDQAIAMVERLVDSTEKVRSDGLVPGDWDRHLKWLDSVLGELWASRGPYPGIAPVLGYLGHPRPFSFQKDIVEPREAAGADGWDITAAILEGIEDVVVPGHTRQLLDAGSVWRALDQTTRDLLKVMARFAISGAQLNRVMHAIKRTDAGMDYPDQAIIDNPYLIAERDLGDSDSPPISFEVVDRGMLPWAGESSFERAGIAFDDDRRVRAALGDVLRSATALGDTILPLEDSCRRVERTLPSKRRLLPDPTKVRAALEFYSEHLSLLSIDGVAVIALRDVAEDEALLTDRLRKMSVPSHSASGLDWISIVRKALDEVGATQSDHENEARAEKADALERAFTQRLSIISGSAGTGKTTVVRALLDGIHEVDGKSTELLLAPTGRSRVRLSEATGRQAQTIHRFLNENKWLGYAHDFYFKRSGGATTGANTVVIDEASMIPVDLMATLFRAIDWNDVRRLVLVGDPGQLPPIGPGRPFTDLIGWCQENKDSRLITLKHRGRFEAANSLALRLADGYAFGEGSIVDDEVLSRVARSDVAGSDLAVFYWKDTDELTSILLDQVEAALSLVKMSGFGSRFDQSFKKIDGAPAPEAWQILSPLRRKMVGTDELNRIIQLRYHQDAIEQAKQTAWTHGRANHQIPRPFGDHQIVWNDKVIQNKNSQQVSWMKGTTGDQPRYIANGEIGIATWTEKRKSDDLLTVEFSTHKDIRFKYNRGQAAESLELAYAITVHKSQGSEFDTVFLVIPKAAPTLSRELIYTALTRFKKRLVLLLEEDITPLQQLRKPAMSDTLSRNTNVLALSMRPDTVGLPHPENLIHRLLDGTLVRSKNEAIVATLLTDHGLTVRYEEPLYSRSDPKDFRLPDFTVTYEGEIWYWEHLGMMTVPSYAADWERKKNWYEENGYMSRVLTSRNGADGGIDLPVIERTIREQILTKSH